MKNKTNKQSLLKRIFIVVGYLVILAIVVDVAKYSYNKLKDPTSCDNEEALKMVGNIIEKDVRAQYEEEYPKENVESPWYNARYKADAVKYDFHLQEFSYLDGDKKSCLGMAYFTNGSTSKYKYEIFYDKKNKNLSVQTYRKRLKDIN